MLVAMYWIDKHANIWGSYFTWWRTMNSPVNEDKLSGQKWLNEEPMDDMAEKYESERTCFAYWMKCNLITYDIIITIDQSLNHNMWED